MDVPTAKLNLQKRAYSKWKQSVFLADLIDLNNERKSHYLKAATCCSHGEVKDGKVVMIYCKSRVCVICNRNRTGSLINKYKKSFEGRKVRLTTLTVPNVYGSDLRQTICDIKKVLLHVRRKFTREFKKTVNGVYSVEVTFNAQTKKYHPHLHMLSDYEPYEAAYFISYWMDFWKSRGVLLSRDAQDSRPADAESFHEVFKYSVKMQFSMPNEKGEVRPKYEPEVIDTIIEAMWGLRMVQTFGDIRAEEEEVTEESTYTSESFEGDVYVWYKHDWYSYVTGEALSEFTPLFTAKQRRSPGGPFTGVSG